MINVEADENYYAGNDTKQFRNKYKIQHLFRFGLLLFITPLLYFHDYHACCYSPPTFSMSYLFHSCIIKYIYNVPYYLSYLNNINNNIVIVII